MSIQTGVQVRADAELLGVLRHLGEVAGQADADLLLARVVWSRLTEPGDAVAGTLISWLGAVEALDLVVAGADIRTIEAELRAAGTEDPPTSRQLGAAVKRWRLRVDREATLGDLRTASAAGMRIITPGCANWPEQLLDLDVHAPHALWVRGSPELFSTRGLAVVGARACTGYGSQVTAQFTGEACAAGFTIVSGAAYGVDAVAHRAALSLDAPTIAVLAGGADRPYPASHAKLLSQVAEQGAVCSEMVPGSVPTRWRFLQRNRLIAALSQAVLVTEAGVRSGTINTAGHGAELGRAIGAVPGPITSAASAGCHRLIRDYGAALITSGADLLELLGVSEMDGLFGVAGPPAPGSDRLPSLHVRILDALPLTGGRSVDEVARSSGVSPEEARNALNELELLRFVSRTTPTGDSPPLWMMLRRK